MRQIHTARRPESEVEQRYWRCMERLRISGQLLVGLLALLILFTLLYCIYGDFLGIWSE